MVFVRLLYFSMVFGRLLYFSMVFDQILFSPFLMRYFYLLIAIVVLNILLFYLRYVV